MFPDMKGAVPIGLAQPIEIAREVFRFHLCLSRGNGKSGRKMQALALAMVKVGTIVRTPLGLPNEGLSDFHL